MRPANQNLSHSSRSPERTSFNIEQPQTRRQTNFTQNLDLPEIDLVERENRNNSPQRQEAEGWGSFACCCTATAGGLGVISTLLSITFIALYYALNVESVKTGDDACGLKRTETEHIPNDHSPGQRILAERPWRPFPNLMNCSNITQSEANMINHYYQSAQSELGIAGYSLLGTAAFLCILSCILDRFCRDNDD